MRPERHPQRHAPAGNSASAPGGPDVPLSGGSVASTAPAVSDLWLDRFTQHLTTERAVSPYTVRNYSQILTEFFRWHQTERGQAPIWRSLHRDDFRAYL